MPADRWDGAPQAVCPFCDRSYPTHEDGSLYRHNHRHTPFVASLTSPDVKVANDCPGSGCVPRRN